jgi:hypothetical protein
MMTIGTTHTNLEVTLMNRNTEILGATEVERAFDHLDAALSSLNDLLNELRDMNRRDAELNSFDITEIRSRGDV